MELRRHLSPQAHAYLALRGDGATYVGKGLLPSDIFFSIILPYVSPPSRAFVPTTPLMLGPCHHLADINISNYSPILHAPLSSINEQGDIIIPRQGANFSEPATVVVQLDDRLSRYETDGHWVDGTDVPFAHYAIAFSATHVAVCSMIGLRGSVRRAYRIRIWRNDAGPEDSHCAYIEHQIPRQATYDNVCACPVISNGSGTLYITQFSTDYETSAVILRYRLNEHGLFVHDSFTCDTPHAGAYWAAGDFLCVAAGYTYTYRIPHEIVDGNVSALDPWRVLKIRNNSYLPHDGCGDPFMSFQHMCIDADGSLLVVEDYQNQWALRRIDGQTGVVTELGYVDRPNGFIARAEGDFRAARPLLHPSGRIFIVWCQENWGLGMANTRVIHAQELVKQ